MTTVRARGTKYKKLKMLKSLKDILILIVVLDEIYKFVAIF